jgi:hypothetical protein
MKVNQLKSHIGTLERIKEAASRLHYYARFRRVTHTVRQLRVLINEIALFKSQTDRQDANDALHEFFKLLHLSQIGPSETRIDTEGIYIAGTFDPAILSRYILIAEQPPTLYIAKGAEDKR